MCCRGLQSVTLFKIKTNHFSTQFKIRDPLLWPFLYPYFSFRKQKVFLYMYHIHNWCHKLLLAHTRLGQIAILSRQIKQHKSSNSSTKFGWRIWMILPKWLVFWGQVVAVEVQLQWRIQGRAPPYFETKLRPNCPPPPPSRLEINNKNNNLIFILHKIHVNMIKCASTCIEVNSTECKHYDIKFPFCSELPSAALVWGVHIFPVMDLWSKMRYVASLHFNG